ncbi:uncharacterized protein LOC129765224 [Toxorhynchites rutilus septentrionalis]|uniref:uncharacterized protein LOC129765224 n=1 Tax=Toxorhynchites rutilus septentrionalis TaxID=329112 RepID=UPI00247B2A79|nr:uncharacterized protein LOC129765224 [Toxorhynchites rutilus septentrionalis]XP_055621272.1 uncharacterized protein LOC129765224 [Toxorhynchites rutilus septentrionalis]
MDISWANRTVSSEETNNNRFTLSNQQLKRLPAPIRTTSTQMRSSSNSADCRCYSNNILSAAKTPLADERYATAKVPQFQAQRHDNINSTAVLGSPLILPSKDRSDMCPIFYIISSTNYNFTELTNRKSASENDGKNQFAWSGSVHAASTRHGASYQAVTSLILVVLSARRQSLEARLEHSIGNQAIHQREEVDKDLMFRCHKIKTTIRCC